MKRFVIALVVLFVGLTFVNDADARRRRRGRRSYVQATGASGYPTAIEEEKTWTVGDEKMSLQQIAQLRADAMAREGNLSHGIEYTGCPTAPIAEGIGCATWEKPEDVATCVCGSTVVADAHAKSNNGMWYRVRFWR